MPGAEPYLDFLDDVPPIGPPDFWKDPHGRRIAWNEYGDPDGEVVMYYHGWPSSRIQARAVHHPARERGLRVIALDRPGMGKSDFAPGRKIEDWAPLIAAFADDHGIGKFAQLGVSGGGPYVLPTALAMPERITASAVLCGAVPLGAGYRRDGLHPIYRLMIRMKKLPAACFTPIFGIAGRMSRLSLSRPPLSWVMASLPESDREVLRQNPQAIPIFAASFEEGVLQGGRGVMGDADIYLREWTLDLSAMRHPIRYWHGRQDHNIPAALAEHLVSKIPGATLEMDPDLGHFSLALHKATESLDHLAASFAGT